MAILVIEEGAPNGMDLVMGDHLLNETALQHAAPRPVKMERARIWPIGEGYAVTGFTLQPGVSAEGEVACLLIANVVKPSQLVQVQTIVPVAIGILGKTTAQSLRESYDKGTSPPEEA